jgi:hypothetical protein
MNYNSNINRYRSTMTDKKQDSLINHIKNMMSIEYPVVDGYSQCAGFHDDLSPCQAFTPYPSRFCPCHSWQEKYLP